MIVKAVAVPHFNSNRFSRMRSAATKQQNNFTMTDDNQKKSENQKQSELEQKAAKLVEVINSNATKEERESAIWKILQS